MTINRRRRVLAKAAVVAGAVAALGIVAAGPASAATAAQPQTDVKVLAWSDRLEPTKTKYPPEMKCPSGYFLINQDYSPGRAVPRGVEVIENGLVGVTISGSKVQKTPDGKHIAPVGTDPHGAFNSATSWDPFSPREVSIFIHCTTDLSKTDLTPI